MLKTQNYSDFVETDDKTTVSLSFIEGALTVQLIATKFIQTDEVEGVASLDVPLTRPAAEALITLLSTFKDLLPPTETV